MMFFPLGYDGEDLRRWPVVTFVIIALCWLAFVANSRAPDTDGELIDATFEDAASYYEAHPELVPHPLLRYALDESADTEAEADADEEADADVADLPAAKPAPVDVVASHASDPLQPERQRRLDALTAAWLDALRDSQSGRYGWIPGEVTPMRVVSHMFVHGDFFHLFFNMLFLYVSAPLVEDMWGRAFFGAFYFLAGVASSALFGVQYPLPIPLIGASGAISGVMGALLVCRPRARVRVLAWWGFVLRRFTVPVWMVLCAWAVDEIVTARGIDPMVSGVANWAHVYGFAFGLVVAGMSRLLGIEARLAAHVRGDADHAVLRKVERALARNRHEDAWRRLARHLASAPGDRDAALVYWQLAKDLDRAGRAAPFLVRVIRDDLQRGDHRAALDCWTDLRTHAPDLVVDVDLSSRIAAALADDRVESDAEDLVRETLARIDSSTAVATLLELARAAEHLDAKLAARTRAVALAHPSLPAAQREELAAKEAYASKRADAWRPTVTG
jgi:membrane associated rhomboid family serine protease